MREESRNHMGKKKILLVEDDRVVVEDIENMLKNIGYSVTSLIPTRKDLLKDFTEFKIDPPDLILMDIELQAEWNGIDLASQIRRNFDIPIVYVTGHSDEKIVDKAKMTEPSAYLLKPIDEKKLHVTVEIALHKHAIEKQFRERMEKALQESEDRYRILVENINEGIIMQDKRGIITYANQKFLDMIGFKQEEVMGKPIIDFLGEGLLREDRVQKSGQREAGKNTSEFSWKRKDGMRIFTILSPKPIYDEQGRYKGSVSVLTDITERRKVEKELLRSRELLRNLSHHIQSVKERESQRIAREIHDELGQMLTALKMDISWLSRRISLDDENKKRFQEKTNSMNELIEKTIQTVQKISSELRPGLLDDLGLIPALEWLAQDFQDRTNIRCRTLIDCRKMEFDADLSTAIFRIVQEALTNTTRHSKATEVNIFLKEKESVLELRIQDDGRGITESEIYSPSSLGLMGMRERLRPFGGELKIEGIQEQGTILRIALPLK